PPGRRVSARPAADGWPGCLTLRSLWRRVPVIAVVPRADVPARVQRLPAQRTRRPAGGDHPTRPLDERPGLRGRDAHPQPVEVLLGLLRLAVAYLDRLDHHRGRVDVEGQ